MLLSVMDLVAKAKPHVKTATASEAAAMIAEDDNLLLIDVREAAEHNEGSIKEAVNIPRGILEMNIGVKTKDPERPIMVHCAVGGRAVLAAKSLSEMGYKDVTAVTAKFEDLAAAVSTAD